MDRRERQDILGQWGVRDANPLERAASRKLERDLAGSPLLGSPLRERVRNFRPSAESYVASLSGPLPYMRRLREIEDRVADHLSDLEAAWHELAAECAGDPERFASRWRRIAARADFGVVNDLIARHNTWYPVEARLPMDVTTQDFALVAGRPYRLAPVDAAWVLERFPADLALAQDG